MSTRQEFLLRLKFVRRGKERKRAEEENRGRKRKKVVTACAGDKKKLNSDICYK
jgi:hypothetical protein